MKLRSNTKLLQFTIRHFAPPPTKAKGGPPGASAPYVPKPVHKTPFQSLIEKGQEFPLGPPPGINKIYGAHRDVIIPKIEPRIEVFAKKLREVYIKDGIISDEKEYIDYERDRQPEDTLEKLIEAKLVPAVIEAREEFKDLDLVLPWRVPYQMMRANHGFVKPFYLKYNDEEIRVTLKNAQKHPKREYVYHVELQRYIVGRPNLLNLPVLPVQEEKSLHFEAGTKLSYMIKDIYVWSFIDKYPPLIEVDCKDLTPNYTIKIGDLEKMLPHGMFLHKMYDHRKNQSVVKLIPTNLYMQRKNTLSEQTDAIKEQKKKIQMQMMSDQNKTAGKEKKISVKHVPRVSVSAKYITADKKEAEKGLKAAQEKK